MAFAVPLAMGAAKAVAGASVAGKIAAAGTAVSAVGGIHSMMSQSAMAKANAQAGEFEAQELERQAIAERAAASHNANNVMRRSKEILARQRAQAAAGGGSTTDGSVVALRNEAVGTASLNSLLEMAQGEQAADNMTQAASEKRYETRLGSVRAKQNILATGISTAGSLLSGGASWAETFG